MSRMVKDFIEVNQWESLDSLIERLTDIRASLPEVVEAEVKMRGDDVFGRKLSVAYYRPQTPEEAESDARCAEAYERSREQALEKLHDELGFCRVPERRTGKLRIVA